MTVVAPNGMHADSLASALTVLGSGKGVSFVKKVPDVQAYFIQRKGEGTILKIAKGE